MIPSKEEEEKIIKITNKILSRLKKVVPKNTEVELTGSIAKRTFLKDDYDIDIFLLFPPEIKKEDFEKITKNIVEKALSKDIEICYAEHPYIKTRYGKFTIDVVPAYNIKYSNKIKTAVDRTQLHTKYINSKINDVQRNEVRKLKYLLKKFNLYGAEIKTQGFSGYLCELLILYYKTLNNLMENASKWKKTCIDIERKQSKKFEEDFVVIDPTDGTRNVAAAVSKRNYLRFIKLAREFPKIKKRIQYKNTYVIELKPKKMNEQKIWGKINRLFKNVFKEAKKELEIIDYEIINEKLIFLTNGNEKEQIIIHGPFFLDKKNVEKFRKKHKNVFISNDRVIAIEKRKIRNGLDIKKIIKRFDYSEIIDRFKIRKANKKDVAELIIFYSKNKL